MSVFHDGINVHALHQLKKEGRPSSMAKMVDSCWCVAIIMRVMMLYVIYYPFETFLIFWVMPVPLWALLGVYVLYDLHPVLLQLAGDQVFTGVAHAGHLGGLAFGFVYWRLGLRLETVLDLVPRRRRRSRP